MGLAMNAIADAMGHADIHTTRDMLTPRTGALNDFAAVGIAGKKTQKLLGGKQW
jgi:hypothetical protein